MHVLGNVVAHIYVTTAASLTASRRYYLLLVLLVPVLVLVLLLLLAWCTLLTSISCPGFRSDSVGVRRVTGNR